MRRPLLATTLALATTLLLTASALAGGWAAAVLDDDKQEPTAGQTATVGFTLLQHGETRVSWPSASITFTKDGSSEKAVFAAKAAGPTGHYTAEVKLPSAGSWSMRIATAELEVTTVLRPMAVKAPSVAVAPAAPAAAQPAAVQPPAPAQPAAAVPTTPAPVQTAPTWTMPVLLALALVIAGILGAGVVIGRRNGSLGRPGGTIAGR